MSIAVTCSACQTSFKVKDELAGRRGRCLKCKAVIQVPGVAAASSEHHREAPPKQKPVTPAGPTTVAPAAGPPRPPSAAEPAPKPVPARPAPVVSHEPPPAIARPAVGGLSSLDVGEDFNEPLVLRPARGRSSHTRTAQKSGGALAKFHLPVWGWCLGGVAALLLVVGATFVGTLALQNSLNSKPVADAGAGTRRQPTVVKSNPAPFNPEAVKTVALKNDKPLAGAPLEDIVDYVKPSIVKIETSDAFNRRTGLGSGFIIDAKGVVATNYHVVSDAAKAEVVFNDGTRFGVEGYVALNPQTDLCLLKLNGVPPNVKALQLATGAGPRDASKVYAIGHPHNHVFTTTDGIVGRVVHTAQLPADTRAWLRGSLQGEPDNVWIQHSAKISPGNSGGPLINADGDVLGVNSWINEEVGFGYAIHANHLEQLIANESATVTALKDKQRKAEPSPADQITRDSFDPVKLQKLAEELSSKKWRPSGEEDCASFDSLALGVTLVRMVQDGADQGRIPPQERAAMIGVVDQIIDTLRKVEWQEDEQIAPINAHAGRPNQAREGAFLFGVFKQRIDLGNRRRGWLVELKGSDKLYFIPSDNNDPEFKDGDCALVLGIAIPEELQFGENRLKPLRAQVLLTDVMLKVSDGPGGSSGQPAAGAGFGNDSRSNMGLPGSRPGSRPRPGSRRPGSFPR